MVSWIADVLTASIGLTIILASMFGTVEMNMLPDSAARVVMAFIGAMLIYRGAAR